MSVTLYSQPGCGPCAGIKGMLNRKEVEFVEVNVREDETALMHIRSLGASGTPVLVVGDEHFISPTAMRDRIASL